MEIKGKVVLVLPMATGTGTKGEWKRQEVVIQFQDGGFDKKLKVTSDGDTADRLSKLSVGQEGTFHCNMPSSREYNEKWYTEVKCWRFEAVLDI